MISARSEILACCRIASCSETRNIRSPSAGNRSDAQRRDSPGSKGRRRLAPGTTATTSPGECPAQTPNDSSALAPPRRPPSVTARSAPGAARAVAIHPLRREKVAPPRRALAIDRVEWPSERGKPERARFPQRNRSASRDRLAPDPAAVRRRTEPPAEFWG